MTGTEERFREDRSRLQRKVCDETMKILALESCHSLLPRRCGGGGACAQSFQNSGLTHSRTLLPMARTMLNNCGRGWSRWT